MTSNDHKCILVTGANSGLGLGICIRLIDEFLASEPETVVLTLIFTTRTARKSAETLETLQSHVAYHPAKSAKRRILLQPESVELTNLLSVRALAQKLLSSSTPHLNAILLNAGIGGWAGLDWPMVIRTVLADIRRATTWPPYKLGVVGLTTKPQFPIAPDGSKLEEPPLAEVFTANVFGHYMLAHWLMSLLWACSEQSPGKLVWVGSIEGSKHHYNSGDPQGFLTPAAYEHSKRVTDLLALTHTSTAARKSLDAFFAPPADSTRRQRARPTIQVSHPGIVVTTIVSLYWIIHQFYFLGVICARLVGSPWSTVYPYPAAAAATFLGLASAESLENKELEGARSGDVVGQAKWGSAVSRLGAVAVRRSDVDGWGLDGSGESFTHLWWGGQDSWGGGQLGRAQGARDASKEDVEAFIQQGAGVWRVMEEMRVEWEGRLEEWDRLNQKTAAANGKS